MTNTKVTLIYGDADEYLNKEKLIKETGRARALFGDKLEIISFKGGHEVNVDIIADLANR